MGGKGGGASEGDPALKPSHASGEGSGGVGRYQDKAMAIGFGSRTFMGALTRATSGVWKRGRPRQGAEKPSRKLARDVAVEVQLWLGRT